MPLITPELSLKGTSSVCPVQFAIERRIVRKRLLFHLSTEGQTFLGFHKRIVSQFPSYTSLPSNEIESVGESLFSASHISIVRFFWSTRLYFFLFLQIDEFCRTMKRKNARATAVTSSRENRGANCFSLTRCKIRYANISATNVRQSFAETRRWQKKRDAVFDTIDRGNLTRCSNSRTMRNVRPLRTNKRADKNVLAIKGWNMKIVSAKRFDGDAT